MNRCLNFYFAPYKTCNLRCRYCYVPPHYKRDDTADDRTVTAALGELLDKLENEQYSVGSFCLHGAEPALLSPDSLATISGMLKTHWARNNINKKRIAIQSNGTLFTNDYLRTLEGALDAKEDVRLGFSIDPPQPVHDAFRDGSYDLVIKNYESALAIGFPVSVLSVVTDKTMTHLNEFKTWMAKQLERKNSQGNPYRLKVKLATGPHGFSSDHMPGFIDFIIKNDFQKLIQILSPGYCLQAGNECEWYEFDSDGNCYSCNKTFMPSGIFASWKTESFAEIVAKRKKLFEKVRQHEACGTCEYEFICNSGCPVDRHQHGTLAGKAHECEIITSVFRDLEQRGIHFTDFYNQN